MNKFTVILLVLCTFLEIKKSLAQPDIHVYGFKNPEELRDYSNRCLSFLEVEENIQVTIVVSKCLPPSYEGQTIKTAVDEFGRDHFTIYLRPGLRGKKLSLVLGHELIHVKQYQSGKLKIQDDKIFWLGKKYYLRENCMFDPPWENEAYLKDYELVRNFSANPQKSKKMDSKLVAKTSASRIRSNISAQKIMQFNLISQPHIQP